MGASEIDLSPSQRKAVEHPGGPLLVKAGPGTGKTRTLIRRIAHLIKERRVEPGSILAITFTNRAAKEMKDRLGSLLEDRAASRVTLCTFHAFGLDVIRREWRLLGFEAPPVLYAEEDQKALLREVLEEIRTPPGRSAVEKVRSRIDAALNREVPLAGETAGFDLEVVHGLYAEKKRLEEAVDYNDLIHLTVRLLEENPDRLAEYRERFRHLFIDEYQDVNTAQVRLIQLLAEGADSLMAIGDPDQAIYSFRGSDVGNFHRFEEVFSGADAIALLENYRSTVTIVSASDQVIRPNPERETAAPRAASSETAGVLLDMHVLATVREEAAFIARRIEQHFSGLGRYGLENGKDFEAADEGEEYAFNDIAVLYRLNAQARDIAAALDKAGIPFQQVGSNRPGLDPFERAVMAAARLAVCPSSRTAWRTLKTVGRKGKGIEKDSVIRRLTDTQDDALLFLEAAAVLAGALPEEGASFVMAAKRLQALADRENLNSRSLLAAAPLLLREDPFQARSEKITLSTLHAAKGLEFPVVFIAGLEEGLIPFIRADEEDPAAAVAEERRLLYVGMTRAKERLCLTRVRQRTLFGKRLSGNPSPFLEDVSGDLVRFVRERTKEKKRRKENRDGGQMKLF